MIQHCVWSNLGLDYGSCVGESRCEFYLAVTGATTYMLMP